MRARLRSVGGAGPVAAQLLLLLLAAAADTGYCGGRGPAADCDWRMQPSPRNASTAHPRRLCRRARGNSIYVTASHDGAEHAHAGSAPGSGASSPRSGGVVEASAGSRELRPPWSLGGQGEQPLGAHLTSLEQLGPEGLSGGGLAAEMGGLDLSEEEALQVGVLAGWVGWCGLAGWWGSEVPVLIQATPPPLPPPCATASAGAVAAGRARPAAGRRGRRSGGRAAVGCGTGRRASRVSGVLCCECAGARATGRLPFACCCILQY